MNTILKAFIKKNSILTEAQNGLREGKSTKRASWFPWEYPRSQKKSNMYLIGIFFDISKGHNVSKHRILLSTLDAYRIRGVANLWFTSYLLFGNECA